MNVLYDTGSSNLWVPNSDCYDGTQVTISTTIAVQTPTSPTTAHSKSSTARIQVRLLLRRPCVSWRGVNRRLHFAEMTDVSELGISYSLEKILTPVPKGSYSSERTGRCWPGARLRLLPWEPVDGSWPSIVSTARTAGFKEDRIECLWHDAVQVQAGRAGCFQP